MKELQARLRGLMDELNPEDSLEMSVLIELFYEQLKTFSEFLDDSGLIPIEKMADFVLYCMKQRLLEEFPELKDWE